MPNGSGRLSQNLDFELKFHPKLMPKLVPKRDPFRNPLFSRFFARGTVLSHLKTTSSANFRKNGPPFWGPFWLKMAKNGAAVTDPIGSGCEATSVWRSWGTPWLSKTAFWLPFCLPAALFLGSSGSPRWSSCFQAGMFFRLDCALDVIPP